MIALDTDAAPQETTLEPPYPNPFNPSTKIIFKVAEQADITMLVFDLLGRKVCSLLEDEMHEAGSYNKYWNGINDRGVRVPSGVYIIQLKAGYVTKIRKVILAR